MTANEDMIAYSRYKQIGDENLYLMEKVHQQQAEIANKKLVNDTFADLIKLQGKKIDEQQAEIEALKQTIDANNLSQNIGQFVKPAKTLTETEDTECQYCKQGCIRCDARKTLTDEEIIEIWCVMETDTGEQNIDFARAILRKAQEK